MAQLNKNKIKKTEDATFWGMLYFMALGLVGVCLTNLILSQASLGINEFLSKRYPEFINIDLVECIIDFLLLIFALYKMMGKFDQLESRRKKKILLKVSAGGIITLLAIHYYYVRNLDLTQPYAEMGVGKFITLMFLVLSAIFSAVDIYIANRREMKEDEQINQPEETPLVSDKLKAKIAFILMATLLGILITDLIRSKVGFAIEDYFYAHNYLFCSETAEMLISTIIGIIGMCYTFITITSNDFTEMLEANKYQMEILKKVEVIILAITIVLAAKIYFVSTYVLWERCLLLVCTVMSMITGVMWLFAWAGEKRKRKADTQDQENITS